MNACPHCQAPARDDWARQYKCGSIWNRGGANRSHECYRVEIAQLKRRVAFLTEAGQDAVNFVEGLHHEYERVVAGWRKANS